MKTRIIATMGLVGLAFTASPASAGGLFSFDPAEPSLYVSGFFGGSSISDATFDGVSAPVAGVPGPTGTAGVPLNVDLEYDGDTTYGGAVGYQLPFKYWTYFQPRLELEISYTENDISAGSFNGGNQAFGGEQSVTFFLLNNYSDIKFSDDQRLVPYIGGGIGLASIDSNAIYAAPGNPVTQPAFAVTGEDTAFTSHAAIGLTYEATDNIEVYAEGRYFTIYGVDLQRTFVGGGADLFVGDVDEGRFDGFTYSVGARLRF